jgi:hypothetical protein
VNTDNHYTTTVTILLQRKKAGEKLSKQSNLKLLLKKVKAFSHTRFGSVEIAASAEKVQYPCHSLLTSLPLTASWRTRTTASG